MPWEGIAAMPRSMALVPGLTYGSFNFRLVWNTIVDCCLIGGGAFKVVSFPTLRVMYVPTPLWEADKYRRVLSKGVHFQLFSIPFGIQRLTAYCPVNVISAIHR